MTIIPAALLTQDDLRLLGNNLTVSEPVVEHLDDDPIAAAERSLAALGERVEWFAQEPRSCLTARSTVLGSVGSWRA